MPQSIMKATRKTVLRKLVECQERDPECDWNSHIQMSYGIPDPIELMAIAYCSDRMAKLFYLLSQLTDTQIQHLRKEIQDFEQLWYNTGRKECP